MIVKTYWGFEWVEVQARGGEGPAEEMTHLQVWLFTLWCLCLLSGLSALVLPLTAFYIYPCKAEPHRLDFTASSETCSTCHSDKPTSEKCSPANTCIDWLAGKNALPLRLQLVFVLSFFVCDWVCVHRWRILILHLGHGWERSCGAIISVYFIPVCTKNVQVSRSQLTCLSLYWADSRRAPSVGLELLRWSDCFMQGFFHLHVFWVWLFLKSDWNASNRLLVSCRTLFRSGRWHFDDKLFHWLTGTLNDCGWRLIQNLFASNRCYQCFLTVPILSKNRGHTVFSPEVGNKVRVGKCCVLSFWILRAG